MFEINKTPIKSRVDWVIEVLLEIKTACSKRNTC